MTKLDAGLMTSLPASDPGSAAVWGSKRINPRPQSCLCLTWSGYLFKRRRRRRRSRRSYDISGDIETIVLEKIPIGKHFFLQLDENTDISKNA